MKIVMKIYIKKSLSTDIIKQQSAEQVKKMIRMITRILNNDSSKFAMKLDTFFYILNFIYNTYNLNFFLIFPTSFFPGDSTLLLMVLSTTIAKRDAISTIFTFARKIHLTQRI